MSTRKHTLTNDGRNVRRSPLHNDRGSVIIMLVFAIAACFAFAVLAIDGAMLLTTRTQLHNAADAAALAGASGLLEGSQDTAIDRAINYASFNLAVEDDIVPVVITADDISFPEPEMIRVRTHRTEATGDALRTHFLRVINPFSNNRANVAAVSAARVFDVCGARCTKPWAIPDRWNDANGNKIYDDGEVYDANATGYKAPYDVGTRIVLKVGNPQQAIEPGVFYPIDYPPLNGDQGDPLTGGSWYEEFIANCSPFMIQPGDQLQIEPGNMIGPTSHGMQDLIELDPGASWDPSSQSIVGSAWGRSPRIALVPFFDPTLPPTSGRNFVTVTKIGAFFIDSIGQGNEVNGIFISVTTQGPACAGSGTGSGGGGSFIKGIALVE